VGERSLLDILDNQDLPDRNHFGLGTAWFGVGVGRGAIITAVHTLVLNIYYWTFSPIGLPSTPTWLDLEHTWISGLPIHFGVIYTGYLLALWAWWRREAMARTGAADEAEPAPVAIRALLFGVDIVVLAGGPRAWLSASFPASPGSSCACSSP
jgi:hypothetical protein